MTTSSGTHQESHAKIIPLNKAGEDYKNPFGKGDVEYASALAYTMVAKLMGKELKLSNQLKKIQSEETQDAMSAAASQANSTRTGAMIDGVGQDLSGATSMAQGSASLISEGHLTAKQSSLRDKQHKLESKLSAAESKVGASSSAELSSNKAEVARLKKEIQLVKDDHQAHHTKKDTYNTAISAAAQFTQAGSRAGTGVAKSDQDAQAALEQAQQQTYKEIASEMSSSNQSVLGTIGSFTQENFAAATAIRG